MAALNDAAGLVHTELKQAMHSPRTHLMQQLEFLLDDGEAQWKYPRARAAWHWRCCTFGVRLLTRTLGNSVTFFLLDTNRCITVISLKACAAGARQSCAGLQLRCGLGGAAVVCR